MTSLDKTHPVVLVVDDEADNVELATRVLKRRFVVRGFTSPAEALASENLPTAVAIVVDFRMPDMDGVELVKRIRQKGLTLGVVMVTAYPDEEAVVTAAQTKFFYRVLTKPIRPEELLQEVDKAIVEAMTRRAVEVERISERGMRGPHAGGRESGREHREEHGRTEPETGGESS